MKNACVGFLELSSIAKGIQILDLLIKKATIHIIFAEPVSSGKYLIAFDGEVEDVRSSALAGCELAGPNLIAWFILPNIHPDILPTLIKSTTIQQCEALGILEMTTCSATIVAVDSALKTSKVQLLKIQLAKGIGGKAYFVIEGEVADVEVALSAGLRAIRTPNIQEKLSAEVLVSDLHLSHQQGVIEKIIIPQANPQILQFLS